MIMIVFCFWLKEDVYVDYFDLVLQMGVFVQIMLGYILYKVFIVEDGECVIIVEFVDEVSQCYWLFNVLYVEVKKQGCVNFYVEYNIKVCEVLCELCFKVDGF